MREAVRKFLVEEELPEAAEGEALFTVIEVYRDRGLP
jgi:hypothetical protein